MSIVLEKILISSLGVACTVGLWVYVVKKTSYMSIMVRCIDDDFTLHACMVHVRLV